LFVAASLFGAIVAVPLANASVFSDVRDGVPYLEAIEGLKSQSVMKGFDDGTFHPDGTMTRAELTKLLVTMKFDPDGATECGVQEDMFSDVPTRAWYFRSVCIAKEKGLVKGHEDGSFEPAKTVTVGEAAMMIGAAFGMEKKNADPWFRPGMEYLAQRGALPESVRHAMQSVTRGEVAEMLWRLQQGNGADQSSGIGAYLVASCTSREDDVVSGVNMQEVRRTWLQWVNDLRKEYGLPAYAQSRQLQRTANVWSQAAVTKGTMTHKRAGQAAYYDYARMTDWFADLGLEFQKEQGMTFTENIGWGYFDCSRDDCTEEFIDAVRSTFNFYLSEKNKDVRPHWNSLVNPHFRKTGIGIAVDEAAGKYYLTTHYGTRITSDPAPVCP
jgi:uncharacterized protein YkwD